MLTRFRIIIETFLALLLVFPLMAGAQYSPETAYTLPLNGSASGASDSGHSAIWWKVTVTGEGALVVTTHASTGLEIDNYLYDQDGTTKLADYDYGGSHPDDQTHYNNLKVGTYYVRSAYNGAGTFTIESVFTPLSLANDAEPNDSFAASLTLSPNGSLTGHLGFRGAGLVDGVDWYRITIPDDGSLLIKTHSDPTLEIDNYLYDQDGETKIADYDWGGSNVDDQTHRNNLDAGTYYLRVTHYNGYGSYTVTSVFTPARLANNPEPDDSASVATTLASNGSDTGRLGFSSMGQTDTADWWKITIPSDGSLLVKTLSDSTLEIDNYLFDQDGTTNIASYDYGGAHVDDQTHHNNLKAGTYYVRTTDYGSGYGSYTITSVFTPSRLANDPEPNDSAAVAVTLDPNGSDTGHIGFYALGKTDTEDWWKITVPKDGKLHVATLSDSTLELDLYLFQKIGDGYYNIKSYDIGSGVNESVTYNNLLPGTYYVRAGYGGYGSYSITSSFTPVHYSNDPEPNDTRETASAIPVQTVKTGHLGYNNSERTDTHDWWSFTVPAGWDTLFVRVMSDSTLEADTNLYDASGNNIAHDGRGGIESGFYIPNPSVGNYSLDYYMWSGYGAYALIVTNHWQADAPVTETEELAPPTQLVVSDVPNDNGHQLSLTWTASTSETGGSVLRYRIFRSLSSVMTDPAPRSGFSTLESLNAWEAEHTVYVDSVAVGINHYTDFVPLNGTPYYYWVQAVGTNGVSKPAASAPLITSVAEVPKEFQVAAPYPNPFNPSVTIGYTLPEQTQVRLTIYDSLGRMVTVLENGMRDAGSHEVVWNGRSNKGETLGSGIYLYRIEAGIHHAKGKMTLLR